MAKSAEKIRPAKRQAKAAKKPDARAKKTQPVSKKFMLDNNAVPVDPALIVTTPTMPSLRPKPARKAAQKRRAVSTKSKAAPTATKARQQQPLPVVTAQPSALLPTGPLPRSNAVVVWKKDGPVDQLVRWLRLSGRGVMRLLTSPPRREPTLAGAKLRTKNELLRELAVLREENAIMRGRLGLPQMPFGRQIVDSI